MIDQSRIPAVWRTTGGIKRSVEFVPGELPERNHNFLVKSNRENVYPDLLESPLPLVSTKLKDIFCSYEEKIECKCALLSDREREEQRVYWLFALNRVDCVSKETEFYPNRFLKKLVLDRNKIGHRTVFRVQGILEKQIIVRFDVAESILRRPLTGLLLKEVECM